MRNRWNTALAIALFVTAAGAQTPRSEAQRLNEWFAVKYEEQLDFSPIRKTILGRKDDYGRMDDVSEAAQDHQLEWARRSVQELRQDFDYALLEDEAKTSYDVWIYQVGLAEAAHEFRRRAYLFHQMDGPHTSLPQMLINYHRVDDESDMLAYIERIGGAARLLRQTLARAKLAAEEGVHAPRFAYEAVIDQSRALVSGRPFDEGEDASDSPLWRDINVKLAGLVDNGIIDQSRAEALLADAASALKASFRPAYEELIAWAESEVPLTNEIETGVWKLPDGKEYYEERLAFHTTTDLTADEIHELGLAEVARIQGEMRRVMEEVEFDGDLNDFFRFVREDPQFVFANDDAGREAYLHAARRHLDTIEARLPDFFGILPKAGLEVRRVEAFREEPGGAQHYMQGTPDGSRPGVFYVHLADMKSMPIPELEVIAYHEGLPGHHMQISIQQELTGIPMFRTQLFFNAYVEGWALYAESLAREMGAYEDPYAYFGRLSAEIWRAIRLVVDTGLHAKGWTQDEAVRYFTDNSSIAEGQIRSEVERYIVMPGQATGYKIGMLKIQALRAHAEEALGDDFDIRTFHDAVLDGGALPLPILEQRIAKWITNREQK
jgi:uncharacterized protein (DUF885 family)